MKNFFYAIAALSLMVVACTAGYYFILVKPGQEVERLQFEKEQYEDEQRKEEIEESSEETTWLNNPVWCQYGGAPEWMEMEDCYHVCCLERRSSFIESSSSLSASDLQAGIDILEEQCYHEYPYDD